MQSNYEFYKNSIKKFGISSRGVQWRSKDTQYTRFKVISYFVQDEIKSSSILDIGCGFGDFYLYLKSKGLLPKRYLGIDSHPMMIEICKERLDSEFMKLDILKDEVPTCDYCIASGSLNLLPKDDTFGFIKNSFNACKKGFVFNILKGVKENSVYNYFTKMDILKLCKKITKNIKIVDFYMDFDMTVYLKK